MPCVLSRLSACVRVCLQLIAAIGLGAGAGGYVAKSMKITDLPQVRGKLGCVGVHAGAWGGGV